MAAIRLPLIAPTSGSVREAFKRQRGKYGQEIVFIFRILEFWRPAGLMLYNTSPSVA